MAITASMVKELREKTGAGMMDCKKALTKNDGDMEKSVEFLREKGLAAAAKKADRVAAEGLVKAYISDDAKKAAIVEVNSETDFVAKNEDFQNFVTDVAEQAINTNATDIDAFLEEKWLRDESKLVKDILVEKISVIGENLSIRRFEKFESDNGFIESYIHGEGRIGVIVELETETNSDAIKEAARNLAMQIAAIAPKYISKDEVSQDYIEKEREILKQQAVNENPDKPENIIDKMIIGRLQKQLKEVCLLDQQYVKDGDLTISKYLDQVSKEVGFKVNVKRFVRFETGEGIEKKEENFADEVAKQLGQ
ncbi:translation elongation factor Ts (EF-Ts) [Natranaerovirga hydrolytica]|uniref:Elongation factor Ts n=1 Tax=Natranaerovirga hydrolytica TaxID=680378 RepID=A0A4R1MXT1_9FIRM|nr:translation elongation factor Ts [Natranaerovirga hydrolytica]TCK97925.1 translation elongation factor Ts (EF-Ts) [Natranaerovirga hydrolytica]